MQREKKTINMDETYKIIDKFIITLYMVIVLKMEREKQFWLVVSTEFTQTSNV